MTRKGTILKRYISVNTDIDGKGYVIFEHIINDLLVMIVYPNVNTTFLFFFFFLILFFFLLFFLILLFFLTFFIFSYFLTLLRFTFKPINAPYSKFERLKISKRNRGCQVEGFLSIGFSKIQLLNRYN